MARKNLKQMLEQKLAENTQRHAAAVQEVDIDLGKRFDKLAVDRIDPNPYQPRRTFPAEALQKLATSIQQAGLAQPISVREVDGRYQIIAGERRWRAHQLLARTHIEAIVVPVTDAEMAVLALAENIDREDLSDYEIACAVRQVESLFPSRTNLAESLGMDRKDLYRYLAFDELPASVIQRLDANPSLFGRAAAEQIKAALKKHEGHPELEDIVIQALDEVEAGRLDQLKVPAFIAGEIKSEQGSGNAQQSVDLTRAGHKVGTVQRKARSLVLTLNTSAFNEKQQQELLTFVDKLIEQGG